MASIEATSDPRAAQKAGAPVLFPTPPAALQVPPVCDPRPRVDSQTHFGIRPALAALQNSFTSRRRASSVSDTASQSSVPRSPHFARFMGLEPRARTASSATVVPQNVKSYPSALAFSIIESPDEHISRAPRIPSFYDMDADSFGHDLGLSLGLNPRFSAASTVRALSLSLTPDEGRAVREMFARSHLDHHQARAGHPPEASAPLSGSAQDAYMSLSAPELVDVHARDTDASAAPTRSSSDVVPSLGSAPTATSSANLAPLSDTPLIDANTYPVADATTYPRMVDTNTKIYPATDSSQRTYPGGSHAQHETDLYLEGVRFAGGALPLPLRASGASSPVSLRSPARSTVVSPTRTTVISPVHSRVVSPMGSLPTTPLHNAPTPNLPSPPYVSPAPTSPSNVAAIPFPSTEETGGYASDDASDFASQYAHSRRDDDVGYDTPTLYTGTTNTSPTLSVTRVSPGEAPPALRLGPGMGFAGVGTYAGGGGVQGGVYVTAGTGAGELLPSPGLLGATRPMTADSGVSGIGRAEVEKDGENPARSPHAESSNRSLHAESSGQSMNAESSGRSTNAESSSGPSTGIRARVTSLRTSHALSVLIPGFIKRARRKSRMGEDDGERRARGRMQKEKKKGREAGVRGEQSQSRTESSRARTESSRGRTESSRPRTERTQSSRAQSVLSSRHEESDEEDISPASSHLDLLSPDPFASTVALKVGAWSQMYAHSGNRGRSRSSAVAPRDVDATPDGSAAVLEMRALPDTLSLPDATVPLPDTLEDNSNEQVEYANSLYADDDSEEESSIRIYSHGRGRSLSQPDVYTIPIEPLHQSNTRRAGSSLARRARGLGNWRRPALAPRPSLPTLSTLSRKDVVMPVPRSAAAARFPAEPWADVERGSSPSLGLPLGSMAARGLGSLEMPRAMNGSPARGVPFPRSPMRGRMSSEASLLLSESSIAEDEDEEEDEDREDEDREDEDREDESRAVSGGEEGKVWWSGPSSRASMSRRSSFASSAAEEDEDTIQMEAGVRDSIASTAKIRDSVALSDVTNRLSMGVDEEVDVASESFLQALDELDSMPLTPPPSSRSSSEPSVESECGPVLNECPTGVGPRYPRPGTGGSQGGGPGGGSQQQGGGDGWKGGAGGGHGYGGSGSGAGGNGGNGNGPRKQAAPDSEPSESSSESESDAPARPGRDTRSRPSMAARSQSMPRASTSSRAPARQTMPVKASSDESDDVPLAQRIPTALRAQKSIRIQDQAGREERRQRRAERMRQRAADKAGPTGGEGGVAPDELTKRLLNVQVGGGSLSRERSPVPSPHSPMPPARPSHDYSAGAGGLFPTSTMRSRTVSNISHMSRSRTHTRSGSTEQPPPVPAGPQPSVSRSGTLSRRRPSAPEAPPVPIPRTSVSRSGTVSRPRGSQDHPREGASLSRNGTAYRHRAGSKTDDEGESSRFQRSRSIRDPSSARPPMPPMPPVESYPRGPSQHEAYVPPVVEQRIYIGDRQKFVIVDVGPPGTTARDVIEVARKRGELEVGGNGGWQLWEQSNECGMERPIRDFEFVNDVLKAWNPEKRVNVLIIRRSPLWGVLRPENIPSSSPTMSGWVMWASKPGKWSKRWLELKEHSLFVCKNDKGKDQTYLCGMSNFDGYIVTHVQRAPKGFVFAAKSTESSGVFEKEEDSSHIFSCDREIGEVWLQKILLARSYVLQQERAVVSRLANSGGLSASKSMLSRSGTKKSTVSSRSAGSQHPPPLVQDLNPSPFVEGSLLAKAAANGN